MKQNKYDDPDFFGKYSEMPRSTGGLAAAGEWEVFRSLLPELAGKQVLDLGCGFGWHCRYARAQGAAGVIGVDLSESMLSRAKAMTDDPGIQYFQAAVEDVRFLPGQFDVVLSSLALHYIEDFTGLCGQVYDMLCSGGSFVFSVEHPIFTALAAQDWHYNEAGEKAHWPVDHYHEEGPRNARFLEHDVVKYHRTVSAYVTALLDAGFRISGMSELKLTAETLAQHPEWRDEQRRPMFMLMSAIKA